MAAHVHEHPADPPDLWGQVLSAACVVHCAVTPVVMAMLPAAASVLGGAHPVLLVAVMGVAVWAFVPGFKRHRRVEVLLEAGLGLSLLALGTLVFHGQLLADTLCSVAGASMMMVAHWRNRKLQRKCCAEPA